MYQSILFIFCIYVVGTVLQDMMKPFNDDDDNGCDDDLLNIKTMMMVTLNMVLMTISMTGIGCQARV